MNKKKILIAILLGLFAISMWFVGISNSKASVVYDAYSLKNNISSVKLYNNSNTLIYGGNETALNTFNALCVNNDSLHTYLLTEQYYNQVRIYTGGLQWNYYFVLDFKNKLYTNDYSFVFNAEYDNNIGPYTDIYVYIIFDDNTSVNVNIDRNSGMTTYVFDYNYFNTNNKLNKNVKSIRFSARNITSIDVFNNNTNLSYDIGYQNGIDSVINSPNNYNLYSYEQYSSAYNYGFQDGLDTDTSTSYDNGYSTGYTLGYNNGYEYALQEYTTTGIAPLVNFNQLFNSDNPTIVGNDVNQLFKWGQATINHKYLIITQINISSWQIWESENRTNDWAVSPNNLYKGSLSSSQSYCFVNITNYNYICFRSTSGSSIIHDNQLWQPMLFDLTQIFGIGSEPTTYEEFIKYFPSNYYNYTITQLVNYEYLNGYNKGVQDMNVVVREKQELLNKAINGDLTFTNMFTSIFDVPVQTITNLLNFNFLGVNLLDFFLSIFTICIIIAILKLIL